MLKREDVKKGVQLLLTLPREGTENGHAQGPSLSMAVGVAGKAGSRDVHLVSGDVLVVEASPRKVGGRYLCRVRRAISQSIGDVFWDDLRRSSAVIG
jgi:hypothetical protein|nr:hypothetical protein [Neorhizobium tomejilense]